MCSPVSVRASCSVSALDCEALSERVGFREMDRLRGAGFFSPDKCDTRGTLEAKACRFGMER